MRLDWQASWQGGVKVCVVHRMVPIAAGLAQEECSTTAGHLLAARQKKLQALCGRSVVQQQVPGLLPIVRVALQEKV